MAKRGLPMGDPAPDSLKIEGERCTWQYCCFYNHCDEVGELAFDETIRSDIAELDKKSPFALAATFNTCCVLRLLDTITRTNNRSACELRALPLMKPTGIQGKR
ncbi:hypothetical protein ABW21_db0200292 [Orbilia brochopaga]|nr:hypothetical protein ABW21_db0200292 [Drechslerella brochopaga]